MLYIIYRDHTVNMISFVLIENKIMTDNLFFDSKITMINTVI